MPKHTCHFPTCSTACPPRHLFCRDHWYAVPREKRDAVNNAFRARRGAFSGPEWQAWFEATDNAIIAVAEREGLGIVVEVQNNLKEMRHRRIAAGREAIND